MIKINCKSRNKIFLNYIYFVNVVRRNDEMYKNKKNVPRKKMKRENKKQKFRGMIYEEKLSHRK